MGINLGENCISGSKFKPCMLEGMLVLFVYKMFTTERPLDKGFSLNRLSCWHDHPKWNYKARGPLLKLILKMRARQQTICENDVTTASYTNCRSLPRFQSHLIHILEGVSEGARIRYFEKFHILTLYGKLLCLLQALAIVSHSIRLPISWPMSPLAFENPGLQLASKKAFSFWILSRQPSNFNHNMVPHYLDFPPSVPLQISSCATFRTVIIIEEYG